MLPPSPWSGLLPCFYHGGCGLCGMCGVGGRNSTAASIPLALVHSDSTKKKPLSSTNVHTNRKGEREREREREREKGETACLLEKNERWEWGGGVQG